MRGALILYFLLASAMAQSQNILKIQVLSSDGSALPFSTIQLIPSGKGTISNEDGFFVLPVKEIQASDSVRINHLGFQTKFLATSELFNIQSISLSEQPKELQTVEIKAGIEKIWAEMIFAAFQKRRKSELKEQASGRMMLRSYQAKIPVEILEGEAHVEIDNTGMPYAIDFAYLNTNMGADSLMSFYNLHTSVLIENFKLFERSEVSGWPLHPGRLGKGSIMKDFNIDLVAYTIENEVSQFELISKSNTYLSARIWLAGESGDILRYEVFGENLAVIPVVSLVKGKSIRNFDAHLAFEFGADNGKLSYLVWDLDFILGRDQEISSSVKFFIGNDTLVKPLFLKESDYHDYAMAAMLPPRSDQLEQEFVLSRSRKDLEALEGLQSMSDALSTNLIFWNPDIPFNVGHIPVDQKIRQDGSRAPVSSTDYKILSNKYNLFFNAIIYHTAESEYLPQAFFDRAISSMPQVTEPSIKLLINLLFDEYAFAAQNIASELNPDNAEALIKMERQKLDFHENLLLMNSQGGNDLKFLLEINHMNYKKHGVDRFYQLNQNILRNPLFEGFDKHLNPESPRDLALALLVIGDYTTAQKILKLLPAKSGDAYYIQALVYYFKYQCDDFRKFIKLAEEEGFSIPDMARALCPEG